MTEMSTRDHIVAVAKNEFLRAGINSTRMDTIAARVGIARPNVYRYFGRKQDLVKEVILREVRAVNQVRRQRLPVEGEVADLILASLVSGAQLIREDGFLSVELSRDSEQITSFLVSNDEDLLATQQEYWEPILRLGRERGELKEDLDDSRIIRWFMSSNFCLVALPEMYPGDPADWFADFVIPPVLQPAKRR
ncbi:TetR/AcrR family transcriptional regulator [Nocardia nova]|uniref:TetR/AcrR family transcriptional regulator n=1 Tax=Nocardia nova TaxID=37330 RepID=UPI0037B82A8C